MEKKGVMLGLVGIKWKLRTGVGPLPNLERLCHFRMLSVLARILRWFGDGVVNE